MSQPMPHLKSRLQLKRKQVVIATAVAILVIALVAWVATRKPKVDETSRITTTIVQRGPIKQTVAATGRVVPHFEVEIKGKASGKIISLPYDVSDYVRAGDLLVQLDPIDEIRQVDQAQASLGAIENRISQSRVNLNVAQQELQNELDKAQANLKSAQARAGEATSKTARLKELYAGEFISQEEYEAGLTSAAQANTELENARIRFNELRTQKAALAARQEDIDIARSEYQSNRVNLLTAQQRLGETNIYAPISGFITSRSGQIGQIVASGISNVSGGTSIMTLADLSRIFVLSAVDESDIGQVQMGQPVKITVDAYPNEVFQGKVVQIASKGVNESDVVTFEVKIEVVSPNKSRLKPEMTANTEILIAERPSTLLVPAEAVAIQDGKHYVTVINADRKQRKRPVQIGITDGIQTEILSGLKSGDKVVVSKGDVQSEWRKKDGGNRPGGGGAIGSRMGGRMMMRGGRH